MYKNELSIPSVIFVLLLIGMSLPGSSSNAAGHDAREIIRKMERILRGDSSQGFYRMSITDPDWKRTLTLRAWEKKNERKTLIHILSPPKEKGIVTLKIGIEMWHYLPRVERMIKIPPSMMMRPCWVRPRRSRSLMAFLTRRFCRLVIGFGISASHVMAATPAGSLRPSEVFRYSRRAVAPP